MGIGRSTGLQPFSKLIRQSVHKGKLTMLPRIDQKNKSRMRTTPDSPRPQAAAPFSLRTRLGPKLDTSGDVPHSVESPVGHGGRERNLVGVHALGDLPVLESSVTLARTSCHLTPGGTRCARAARNDPTHDLP